MASTGPDNAFSKISLIKARLRTEGEDEHATTPRPEPPPSGKYVSSTPFRAASPPPSHDDAGDSGFRPAPLQSTPPRATPPPVQKATSGGSLQKGAAPAPRADFRETNLIRPQAPASRADAFQEAPLVKGPTPRADAFHEAPLVKAQGSSPLQKAPPAPPVQRAQAPPPVQKAPAPANPLQKGQAPAPVQKASPPANPLQKGQAPPPVQKASPPANPLQKGQAPPPVQKASSPAHPLQKASGAPPPSQQPPRDEPEGSGETKAAPVILRSRAAPPPPTVRANNIAGLVSRALGSYVGESAMPTLHDLALLAKRGDTEAPPPPAPPSPAPAAPEPPPRPAEPAAPRFPVPETPRFSAPPTQRLQVPSTARFGSPTTRLAGASVEAFMEGKTDGASLKERELAVALRNLQNAGWTFLVLRAAQTDGTPTEAAGVYRFLLDDKRAAQDRVRLIDPKARTFTVTGADQVATLDYFHGTGAPASLKNPPLAKKLQALAASGLVPEGDDPATPGTWGAYVALMRGGHASLQIEGVTFGDVRGTQAADVDAAAAPLAALLRVHRDVLVPEAQAGRLQLESLGTVLQTLHYDVPDVALDDRVEGFLRLVEAIRRGPFTPGDLPALTFAGAQAFESILELDVGGDGFWEAVSTMETLLGVVAPGEARDPLHFLYREAARVSPFAEARKEREEVFRRVLACGLPPDAAIDVTQHVVARAFDEDLETRVQLFEALTELAGEQAGYAWVMRDFDTVLRFRSVQETLEDAARPYLAIFEALAGRGVAEEAAPTWAFLHEGVRYGYLEAAEGGLQDLADRFVVLFTQVGNVQEARQRLMHYT